MNLRDKKYTCYILLKEIFKQFEFIVVLNGFCVWNSFPLYHLDHLVIAITYSYLLTPRGKFKNVPMTEALLQ